MAGKRRVALIDDADALNEESANCLLKTLEEPPRHAVIILLVTNTDLLLPTIRSRCQVVNFLPLPANLAAAIVLREELVQSPEEARRAAAQCEGSLETARQLLEPALREQRALVFGLLAAPRFDGMQAAARLVEAAQAEGAARGARHGLAEWLVNFMVQFYRQVLRALTGAPTIDDQHVAQYVAGFAAPTWREIDRVSALLERVLAAQRQLDGNASVPLCLEALCDDLARLQR
jgi:DNA polymerase-3 subunit delta'